MSQLGKSCKPADIISPAPDPPIVNLNFLRAGVSKNKLSSKSKILGSSVLSVPLLA